MLTLGEAARYCGVSKATISKAIRVGKLSATRREDGSWSIDSAELARYLEAYVDANGYRFRSKTGDADRQLLEKLRLVHREPRFDIAPELRRALACVEHLARVRSPSPSSPPHSVGMLAVCGYRGLGSDGSASVLTPPPGALVSELLSPAR